MKIRDLIIYSTVGIAGLIVGRILLSRTINSNKAYNGLLSPKKIKKLYDEVML